MPCLFVFQMKGTINVYDVAEGSLQMALFLQTALERALRFRVYERWLTDDRTLTALIKTFDADVLLDSKWDEYEGLVLELPNAVICVHLNLRPKATSEVKVDVVAESRQAATLQLARIKELLPPADSAPSGLINVSFWYSSNGGNKVRRNLEAPSWTHSSGNYPAGTREALEQTMRDAPSVIARGRLLLWHGPPGTGKTSAVRTLARENHRRVGIEYVIDPEAMFGRDAAYFVGVLFDQDDPDEADERIRLLVLEDCDELLSADAKERAGQGLARLLNLVDGLIGQGLRIAVLITTNEPLSAFHPAVSRPGRCGAVVGFDLFGAGEAAAWLARHEVAAEAPGRASLADLLAVREGRAVPSQKAPLGFKTALRT